MKLKDFSSRSSTGGKRRKRQLLIEPPPPPPLPPVSESDGEGARRCHPADLSDCYQATTTATTDKNTISDRCHHHYQADTMKHYDQSRLPTVASHRDDHQSAASVIMQRNKWRRGSPLDNIGQNHSPLDDDETTVCRAGRGTGSRHELYCDNKQQDIARHSTTTTTKRKSELTSFLTILFGSLLATLLLLLASNQPTLCSSDVRTNASSPMNATSAGSLALKVLPITISSSSTTALPAFVLNNTRAGADFSPPETSADGEDDAPERDSPAEETDDGENPHKTRLAGLISESASDGADTLLGHLQPPARANTEEGGPASSADPEETDDEEGAGAGPESESATEDKRERKPAAVPPLKFQQPQNGSSSSSSADEQQLPAGMDDEQTRAAMGVYAKWRFAGDDIIELFSRKLMPVVLEHGYDVDAGTVTGLLQIFNGIRGLRPWAVKLLDASFKLAPGILVGTQSDFGDFDECLNIRVDDPSGLTSASSDGDDTYFPASQLDPLTGLKSTTLVGRYCLADVEFPKPARRRRPATQTGGYTPNTTGASQLDQFEPIELRKSLLDFSQLPAYRDTIFVETGNFLHMLYVDPIRVGVCMTNKIDPDALAQVVNKLLDEFKITINFHGRCATKYDRPTWTVYQRASAYVLLVACSLVLISTLLDLLHVKLNKLPCPRGWHAGRLRLQQAAARHRPLFTSFSLIRNTRRLFRKPPPVESSSSSPQKPLVMSSSNNLGYAASIAATTSTTTTTTGASSLADSSVESSPAIERRSSAGTTSSQAEASNSSMNDLIPRPHKQQQQQQREFSQYHQSMADQHLVQRETGSGPANLMSLHGIRVITMTWMIVNHTYMFGGFFVLWAHRRLIDIAEWPKSLSFQLVLNGWLTVETYFFLSALIIVLTVMPLMRARKFNYFAYIFHRLLRLLPAYLGLVCLNFLWPLISSGPVWLVKGKSFVQTPCEQYLWTNFLFINNWIWPEKQCMVHTWFLSADFQLYLLAPIIVYLLYRRPALGHSLNLLVAICASVLSGFVIYANELLPTTLINKLEFDAIKQQLSYSYFATYQHMGPYCLGILTGYLLHKRPHARLPKHLTWLLWLLLPPLSFTTLLLTYLWNGAYDDPALINPSPLVSAFYVAIHRTIWTALVAWLVFACTTGRAKLLASFLSHSLFLPISRLSYSIYLVHLPVIMFRSLNLRHTLEWTDQNILWEACGNFVVSIFMGYFLNVAFESPIINLENALMRRNRTCHADDARALEKQQATIFQTNKHFGLVINGKQPIGQTNNSIDHKQQDTQGFSYLTTTTGSSSSAASDSASDGCPRDDEATTNRTTTSSQQHEGEPPRVNARSSSLARGSMGDSVAQVRRKSLRPKQTSSVEQIFGNRHEEGLQDIGHHHDQAADAATTASSSLTSNGSSAGAGDERQQQVATMARNNHERSLFAGHRSPGRPSRARLAQAVNSGGGDQTDQDEDIVYSMTDEYRHYAPAGYHQWRRAMNQTTSGQHNQHNRLNGRAPMAMSMGRGDNTARRPHQYATLARSSRLCQDPSTAMMLAASDDFRAPRQPASFRYRPRGSRMAAQHDQLADYPTHQRQQHHHDQLFPNSVSELGVGSPRDYIQHARQQMTEFRQEDDQLQEATISSIQRRHRGNARPGRYNTLTGTGTGRGDWRSQLGPARDEPALAHLMSSWDAPAAWLATNSTRAPSSSGGGGGDGPSLLIPRIDSSTLRRHSQHARSQAAASALIGQHHQLESMDDDDDQDDHDDSKIVEEEPAGEENSPL